MKGKHLVIGLVLFVILVVAGIYFSIKAEIDKGPRVMEQEVINDTEKLELTI
ncbi:hypothetical protein ACXYMX_08335 [Sporosarcina sp. CAU 1771]